MSLTQKIADGTVTGKDFENVDFTHDLVSRLVIRMLTCRPSVFDIVMMNCAAIRDCVIDLQENFIFNVFNYENEELIAHLKASGSAHGFNFEALSRGLIADPMFIASLARKDTIVHFLLKYVSMNEDELERLWVASISQMNVVGVEEIEQFKRDAAAAASTRRALTTPPS